MVELLLLLSKIPQLLALLVLFRSCSFRRSFFALVLDLYFSWSRSRKLNGKKAGVSENNVPPMKIWFSLALARKTHPCPTFSLAA